jgi:ferredoxin
MRFAVDAGKCSGHGQCYTFFGQVFSDDEIGFNAARAVDSEAVPEGLEDAARRGVQICPEGAISVVAE